MRLLKKILAPAVTTIFRQEYLCLDDTRFEQPFRLLCYEGDRFIADVTALHQFTGYHPLLFSFLLEGELSQLADTIHIYWTDSSLPVNEINPKKDALVRLEMKKIGEQSINGSLIGHYEGVLARHRFWPAWRQWLFERHNQLFNRKQGNVFLPGPVYRQVQAAYSLPRRIALITIGTKDGYNLFPTDLHGPLSNNIYIDSLRTGGKAVQQVQQAKKILLSLVEPEQFKKVYALGKNHMRDPVPLHELPFSKALSEKFQLPVPDGAVHYWELELAQSFERGIHQLLLFDIRHQWLNRSGSGRLAHIHSIYGEWRKKQGYSGNYFLR